MNFRTWIRDNCFTYGYVPCVVFLGWLVDNQMWGRAWWNMYAGQQILMNADLYVDKNTTVNGTLTATNIVGNGAGITGISASASFASITGQPTDNTNLSTALSAKQDVLGNNSVTNSMLAGSIATSKISNYTGYSIKRIIQKTN